jgi:2-C-methyl-D-erythritol 4-phosphate cytidylyltransferase
LIHALIPSAGSGARVAAAAPAAQLPKQYLQVAGAALVEHTVRAFLACARVGAVTVVVQPGDTQAAALLQARPRLRIAPVGGPTRAHSVLGGLQWLLEQGAADADWVLVHDAARCCITPSAIEGLLDACGGDAVGGLLALPLPDTLKQGGDAPPRVAATLPRAGLWLAQTPQMFRLGLLRRALLQGDPASITDEASAVEALGLSPLLVQGSSSNFKVTYADDLELARAVLEQRAAGAAHA